MIRLCRSIAIAFTAALVLIVAPASPAHAARPARIDVEGAELFEGPGRGYPVTEKLSRGTQVSASTYPTEGFYKVRTGSGVIGWVSVDSIVVDDLPDPTEPAAQQPLNTPSTADPSNPWRGKAPVANQNEFRNHRYDKFLRLRALIGLDFFSASDVNNYLSFSSGLKNGVSFGGELDFRFTRDLAMVIRVERIAKSIVGRDSATGNSYQLDASAIPVMVGMEVTLSDESNFSSFFGAMAGLGINTTLSSTYISNLSTTSFVSQNFTGLGRFLFAYHVSKVTHVFAEVGYRILRSPSMVPTSEGTGNEIWKRGGVYQPQILDMSGAYLGLGVAVHF